MRQSLDELGARPTGRWLLHQHPELHVDDLALGAVGARALEEDPVPARAELAAAEHLGEAQAGLAGRGRDGGRLRARAGVDRREVLALAGVQAGGTEVAE